MTETVETGPDQPAAAPGRWRRRVFWVFAPVLALAILTTAAAILLPGREIAAPDWVRARVEARIDRALPQIRVSFGRMVLVIEDGWRPRARLRDVEIAQLDGTRLASLTDIEAELAMRPLLRGQIKPRALHLSGAFLTLRRDSAGGFDLALEDSGRSLRSGADLGSIVEGLDQVLETDQLSALRQASLRALTIRYEDVRTRRGWTVDGGRLRLQRTGDRIEIGGDFALLSGGADVATLEVSYGSEIGSRSAAVGMVFSGMAAQDIAAQNPALAWLGAVRAPISGALRTELAETGGTGPVSGKIEIGAGVLQPTDATDPIPFREARAYFTYRPDIARMQFDEFYISSDWATARAEGSAVLEGMEDGWPEALLGQVSLSGLSVNPADLFPEPLQFERADADFRLELAPFRLRIGQLVITDDAAPVRVSGELAAGNEGWSVSLDASVSEARLPRVLAYWPHRLKEPTRAWIADNILDGRATDVHLSLRERPGVPRKLHLGFNITDAALLFLRTLPPAEGVSGHLTITDNRLVAVAETGTVRAEKGGLVDVSGTAFVIPDITIRQGPAEVHLAASGTITAALDLLDHEPFRFLTKAGRPTDLADGRAEVTARLDLNLKPALQPEEVTFSVTGTAHDVRSEQLVPDRVLAAPRLAIAADNQHLQVSGKGRVGQVPFEGSWNLPIGKNAAGASRVKAQVVLSPRALDEFRIALPPGSVSGEGTGRLVLDLARDKPVDFSLRSDTRGLTLRIPQLGWSKAPGVAGSFEVVGRLTSPPSVESISLTAPGLRAEGDITLKADGGLDRARLSSVKAGSWLDAPVVLTGRGANRAPAVTIRSGRVDMRNLPSGGGASDGPMSVTLDRLQITDSIALTGLSGDFNGKAGTFAGKVNGGTRVTGTVTSSGQRSAFEIRSDDAGGVVRSAGMLKAAQGGAMVLSLKPSGPEGQYDGRLTVTDTRLREAPAMAELLHAVSIIGLIDQLSGPGITFADVEARFRLTPQQLILTKSSAIGPSMGVSLDGYYDFNTDRMDMQGVLSPLYLLNGIGSVLTRKGEGFLGFAFNLKGPAANPKVGVNPLSVLTPGMFREIFRRPPPKLSK